MIVKIRKIFLLFSLFKDDKMLKQMRVPILLILGIVIILWISGCTNTTPVILPTTGSISVVTNPANAKVFLDNIDTGLHTPCTITDVSVGSHFVKVTLTNYVSTTYMVNVLPDQVSHLTFKLNQINPPPLKKLLTGISVFPSYMNLLEGESQSFDSVTAYYSDSSSSDIELSSCIYSSDNISCATIDEGGLVTAISDGLATITISYSEGVITKTTTADISVGTVSQNDVAYRALCVGIGDYIQGSENDLNAPPYDVNKMMQVLNSCRFGVSNTTFSTITSLKDSQATKSNILQAISASFSGADNDDVSYFYFSGHGSLVGNTSYICPADITSFYGSAMSVDELESALSSIPGTKVVLLDSCHSGGFIGKSQEETLLSQEDVTTFNENIVNIFSQSQSKSLLTTNQYKVLTSCHYYQYCYELTPETGDPFGVFTMALITGCGYYGNLSADTNLDTRVSLQEAYEFVNNWVYNYGIYQDVQVFPDYSSFTIVEH